MKSVWLILFFVVSKLAAEPLQLEAGGSYIKVTHARYETNPDPSIISEDNEIWSPYVGVRTRLTPSFALRLAYQFVSDLETRAIYSVPPGPGTVKPLIVTPARYRDDLHVVSFGAQFSHPLSRSWTAILSPELNAVFDRGSVQYWEAATINRNHTKVTLGGSVALDYIINPAWSLEFGYRWINASASWDRYLNVFSVGGKVRL